MPFSQKNIKLPIFQSIVTQASGILQ